MILTVRAGTTEVVKETIAAKWYREQIKAVVPELIAKWEPILGVRVNRFFVQQMKTKWGSCNSRAGTIRLNTELAKKPKACIEYIVVHEMVHLLERRHSDRFRASMDRFIPQWRLHRQELEQAPLAHEDWRH